MNKAVFAAFGSVFLWTSPFALFCSKNGNGIYLCIVFLILGGICKWIGNGGLEPTIRVKPKDWWETQFRMSIDKKEGKQLSPNDVQASLDWANYITTANKCPMPSEAEKERIARSMGLTTPKMKQEEIDKWDRLQVGKCYLLKEFQEQFAKPGYVSRPDLYIEYSIRALQFSDRSTVEGYCTFHRFKKNIEEMWNTELTKREKEEARKWVEEYKSRFFEELEEYRANKTPMHTIKFHYDRNGWSDEEFDRKYGFIK